VRHLAAHHRREVPAHRAGRVAGRRRQVPHSPDQRLGRAVGAQERDQLVAELVQTGIPDVQGGEQKSLRRMGPADRRQTVHRQAVGERPGRGAVGAGHVQRATGDARRQNRFGLLDRKRCPGTVGDRSRR